MMAQNISVAGAHFTDVPAIKATKTGGGEALYVDSSDATASASDILSGKTAYAGGEKISGSLVAEIDYSKYATAISFKNAVVPHSTVELHLENVTDLSKAFSDCSGIDDLTVHLGSPTSDFGQTFCNFSAKKIKITGDLSNVTAYTSTFSASNVEEIDADIDLTSALTGNFVFFDNAFSNKCTSCRFVPNTIQIMSIIQSNVFDDATIISIANGLKQVTGKLLITTANTKSRMSEIIGNVSVITSNGETYSFFTASPSGSTTLTSFVTSTKGWSLA